MIVYAATLSRTMLMTEPRRDPTQLDQLGLLGAERVREPLTDVVEVDVALVERGPHDRGKGGLLDVGKHVGQIGIAEGGACASNSGLFAGGEHRQAEQLGPVLEVVDVDRLHRRRRQVAEAGRSVVVLDDPVEVDPAVANAGLVQRRQLIPERGDLGLGERDVVDLEELCRTGRATINASPFSAFPAVTTSGTRQTRPRCQERHETFVLDVLGPFEPHRASGVSVPEMQPHRWRAAHRPTRRGRRP